MDSFSHGPIGVRDKCKSACARKTSMEHNTERRVVITGLGVVAANGIGKEAFWRATSRGISGIKPISRHPTSDLPIAVAGEVSDFVVNDYIERKLVNQTDRMTISSFVLSRKHCKKQKKPWNRRIRNVGGEGLPTPMAG